MIFKVTWTDRSSELPRSCEIDAVGDVFAVEVPAQPDEPLPALKIHVNSDAIIVDTVKNDKLWSMSFSEMVADAAADGAFNS